MNTVTLGSTGVSVSEVCLGAMHIGSNTPADTSTAILDAYCEAGGMFIDSANIYNRDAPGCSGGDSERFIGSWMKARGNRSNLFIATKVGMGYPDQPEGLRADQIAEECEKSLQRLGIDTIDLYYAHIDDRNTPLEESLKAFDRVVQDGKVRFIAASNYYPTRLVEAIYTSRQHALAEFCCIQQRYAYLRPRPGARFDGQKITTDDLMDYCSTHNFPLIAYAPLLKGALAGRPDIPIREKYVSEDSIERLKKLKSIAQDLNASPAQVALAWMRRHEATVIPLIGVSSVNQLNDCLGALDLTLDDSVMERLD